VADHPGPVPRRRGTGPGAPEGVGRPGEPLARCRGPTAPGSGSTGGRRVPPGLRPGAGPPLPGPSPGSGNGGVGRGVSAPGHPGSGAGPGRRPARVQSPLPPLPHAGAGPGPPGGGGPHLPGPAPLRPHRVHLREQFSEEFIRAISAGVAGAWRERWWTVDLLLLHGVEGLSGTERSQEEFFHLFEALKRRGARVLLAGDRPPSAIQGVDDRLRSRFEGGLVVELGRGREGDPPRGGIPPVDAASAGGGASAPPPNEASAPAVGVGEGTGPPKEHRGSIPPSRRGEDVLVSLRALVGLDAAGGGVAGRSGGRGLPRRTGEGSEGSEEGKGGWFPSPEKVVWNWPRPEDRIVDERAGETCHDPHREAHGH
jgi:hypothetical protein